MRTVRDVKGLRSVVAGWKRAGQSVGVVPTMGALHEGHLSLVAAAKAGTDRVIATVFVNPMQFNNAEDLARYPRTEDRDAAMLMEAGVDLLFAPAPEVVYPDGFATTVGVSGLSTDLEGTFRPGHFDGVATVVTKLLMMTGADRAYFGEKDWQQLQIVRRLVRDLDIPATITGCATRREADGLAMSSRNLRLSAQERAVAPALHRAMAAAAAAIKDGAPVPAALASARDAVVAAGFAEVEYLELREAEGLAPLDRLDRPARLLAAAWLGPVRLIDNIAVAP
ncbi:pantoate--beta-alanine ligase [Defluviimonas sp. D31]|uniref:pantoate--beta-alanine ligase n=1 Tax=Defluviimonas sp. D31 TaxID=3083253 RepID=UPI00296E9112|nr:pantoate--beta-alanine ligase [Defluviimonas sp. D31]MDW4550930.1 pantoate--beta-alanine ligase [Defluviimonas sp. D31]